MENSEHVFLRNVNPAMPGVLVANLLRPLQLAPNASMSLSTLNVSLSRGVTVEDGETVGAAYGTVSGPTTRYNIFAQPTPGTYTSQQFADQVALALNQAAVLYEDDEGEYSTELNKNPDLGATMWTVAVASGNTDTYTVTSSAGFGGDLAPQADFGNYTNCVATGAGVVTANGAGFMSATFLPYLAPAGAHWITLPNNLDPNGFTTDVIAMAFDNGVDEICVLNVLGDSVNDGDFIINLTIRNVDLFATIVTSSPGNGIAVGLIRERGGLVVAWQDASLFSTDVAATTLYDTRAVSGTTLAANTPVRDWLPTTRLTIQGTARSATTAFQQVWVTPVPTTLSVGVIDIWDRGFAPGGLADELGFVDDGITGAGGAEYVDDTYTARGPTYTFRTQAPTRNDAINGALIVTSDDIPASGRIADITGSARERALIDFISATAGLNGESTYEQAYPRHCYIKNRDVLSLQQMSIRLLDQAGADAARVRPGGCAMLTFHNVVR